MQRYKKVVNTLLAHGVSLDDPIYIKETAYFITCGELVAGLRNTVIFDGLVNHIENIEAPDLTKTQLISILSGYAKAIIDAYERGVPVEQIYKLKIQKLND